MAFQNTLLRHIHVTLGLRHPWLRTVLEGHPPQAPHTTQLYSMSSQGNSVEYSASSLHPAHSSVQYSGREFHPHPDNCQSPPQDSLPATNAALGMENDWCNSPPHPARSRQTGSPGGNWRPGKSLPAPDTPPGLRRCPETRCRPQSPATHPDESTGWSRYPARLQGAATRHAGLSVNRLRSPRPSPQSEPGLSPTPASQTGKGYSQPQRLRPTFV